MSLINQYLEKNGNTSGADRPEMDVPPVLKAGSRSSRSGLNTWYRMTIGGLVLVLAFAAYGIHRLSTSLFEYKHPASAEQITMAVPVPLEEATVATQATAPLADPVLDEQPLPSKAPEPLRAESYPRPEQNANLLTVEYPKSGKSGVAASQRALSVGAETRAYPPESLPPDARSMERAPISPPEPVQPRRGKQQEWMMVLPEGAPPLLTEDPGPARRLDPPKPQVTTRSVSDPSKGNAKEQATRFYQLGLAAQQEGRLTQAEGFYRQTLTVDQRHSDALNNLAVLLMEQGRPDAAEEILQRLLTFDRNNTGAYNNLGLIRLRKKDSKGAVDYFTRALAVTPASRTALLNLAWLARQQKDYAAGNDYFDRLITFGLHDREMLLAYGSFLEQQDAITRALVIYRQALTMTDEQKDKLVAQRIKDRMRLLSSYQEEPVANPNKQP